jgi:hypothetical protein
MLRHSKRSGPFIWIFPIPFLMHNSQRYEHAVAGNHSSLWGQGGKRILNSKNVNLRKDSAAYSLFCLSTLYNTYNGYNRFPLINLQWNNSCTVSLDKTVTLQYIHHSAHFSIHRQLVIWTIYKLASLYWMMTTEIKKLIIIIIIIKLSQYKSSRHKGKWRCSLTHSYISIRWGE